MPKPSFERTGEELEQLERTIDVQVLELLRQKREIFNAGKKGIILKFKQEEISNELRDSLKKKGLITDEDIAVKALKVFKPGDAKKEHNLLKKAHSLVEKLPAKKDLALVPKPLDFRTLEIDNDLRDYLNSMGAGVDEKVGVILMDFVEGEDLATMLYKEVLRRSNYSEEYMEKLTFPQLQIEVISRLGFQRPGRKGRTEGEQQFEETKVLIENANKLISFLKKHSFRLDPKIPERIRKTVELFHQNFVFHNDLHERNIIVNQKGDETETYIIDFGNASERVVDTAEAEVKVTDDFDITRRLKLLTKSAEEEEKEKTEEEIKIFEKFKDRLKNSKDWTKKYQEFKKKFEQRPEITFKNYFAMTGGSDIKIQELMVLVATLVEENPSFKLPISDLVNQKLKEPRLHPFARKKLVELKKYIEK